MTLVWNILECPGCGATVTVGICSLAASCKIDGYFYVDVASHRGWYSSRAAFEAGNPRIAEVEYEVDWQDPTLPAPSQPLRLKR